MWGWIKAIGSFLTGGSKMADKAAEMIDESINTSEERTATDQADLKDARITPVAPSHNTWFDALVDGVNRLPRPAFAIWAFGELVGWWNVAIASVSSEKMQLIILIITFYFGGRAILKDLPAVIKALRSK